MASRGGAMATSGMGSASERRHIAERLKTDVERGGAMDKVEIREDQATPMDAIAPGVQGLKIMFVNVFGVRHADGSWTLIDAGVPFSAGRIRSWAEKRFGG